MSIIVIIAYSIGWITAGFLTGYALSIPRNPDSEDDRG